MKSLDKYRRILIIKNKAHKDQAGEAAFMHGGVCRGIF